MSRNAISTFSGMGGGALAAARSGYDVTCFDFDADAVATLQANGYAAHLADVGTVNWSPFNGADLLVGGPPCQSFSQAGKQAGETDPRNAIPAFVRAVRDVRPRLFVMENVKALAGPKNRAYLESVIAELEALGYIVDYRVLSAADFGVPQDRRRVFVVGRRDSVEPVWPLATHGKVAGDDIEPWVTVEQALGDDLPAGPEYEWLRTRPATTVVGSFGANVLAAPGYRTKGGPSRQNAPGSIKVTHDDRLVLQGFPLSWKIEGSKSSIDRQLGNACPPALLQAVITANVGFTEVYASTFKAALDRATVTRSLVRSMLGNLDEQVDPVFYLTDDYLTGFAIDQDNSELCLLFNIGPSGRGTAAVSRAVTEGARRLNCFDGWLTVWYGRQGWKIDHYEDNWTPGEPAVAYMEIA